MNMRSFKVFLENTAGLHGLLLDLAENINKADLWLMTADAFEDINEELLAKFFRLNGNFLAGNNNLSTATERIILFDRLGHREFDGYSVANTVMAVIYLPDKNEYTDTLKSENDPITYAFDDKGWAKYENNTTVSIDRRQIPFGLVLVFILKCAKYI